MFLLLDKEIKRAERVALQIYTSPFVVNKVACCRFVPVADSYTLEFLDLYFIHEVS